MEDVNLFTITGTLRHTIQGTILTDLIKQPVEFKQVLFAYNHKLMSMDEVQWALWEMVHSFNKEALVFNTRKHLALKGVNPDYYNKLSIEKSLIATLGSRTLENLAILAQ